MWKHSFTEAATETTRTPWLAAGRNKPAEQLAEKAAEVGRNDMGGRRGVFGNTTPKMTPRGSRDRTRAADVGGGAFFGKPQERKFGRESRKLEPARELTGRIPRKDRTNRPRL